MKQQTENKMKKGFVIKSVSSVWPKWAAVFPGRPTVWFDSKYWAEAHLENLRQGGAQ
jgi:hypothetical protein